MAITAKEIAKILGISPAAVSIAINNKPGVSSATRERVLQLANENGYEFSRGKNSDERKESLWQPRSPATFPLPNTLR